MKTAPLVVLNTLYNHCKNNDFKHPHMIIAKELLNSYEKPRGYYTMSDIKMVVYRNEGLTEQQAEGRSRRREVVTARQLAMYFIHKYKFPSWSLTDIGNEVGGRDHSTVLYGIKHVNDLIDSDRQFEARVMNIEVLLVDKLQLNVDPDNFDK